jgi:hypothetical protein
VCERGNERARERKRERETRMDKEQHIRMTGEKRRTDGGNKLWLRWYLKAVNKPRLQELIRTFFITRSLVVEVDCECFQGSDCLVNNKLIVTC